MLIIVTFKVYMQSIAVTSFFLIILQDSIPSRYKRGFREYKLVVLGAGGVGKTAVIRRLVTGTFTSTGYDPTIEDYYRKEIAFYDSCTLLEILDTAGTEQFPSMRDLYIKNGQGFILVYSVINAQTFIDVHPLRDQIAQVKGTYRTAIVLVGNKCDMDSERAVATRDGETLARDDWGCPFFETSAMTGCNVREVFTAIVTQIITQRNHTKSGCCTLL